MAALADGDENPVTPRKLFAIAARALIISGSNITTGLTVFYSLGAHSKEEAEGHAMKLAREKMPNADGWMDHVVEALEIPEHIIREAFDQVEEKTP